MKARAKRDASGIFASLAPAALSLAGASVSLYRVITTRAKADQDPEP